MRNNLGNDTRRSFAIMAHIDAGKTTLSERMLWKSGAIRKVGEVHNGDTTMDSMSIERERGITINSAAIRFDWGQWTMSLIDTPGHVDFSMEVERSLRAVDGAVLAICAVSGAQPQTESVWRRASSASIGCLIAVNKMDRDGADFAKAVASARSRLGANAWAVALPLGSGVDFDGALDLISMRAFSWRRDGSEVERPMSPEEQAEAVASRWAIVEALAESGCERALAWFADGVSPSPSELLDSMRERVGARAFVPCFPMSAFKNQGVGYALDLVGSCLPSPLDRGFGAASPFSALVFKTELSSSGQKAFVRIIEGSISKSDAFEVARTGQHGSAARLGAPMSGSVEPLERASAGDVVVFEGLKGVRTGDTLRERGSQIEHERIASIEPVVGWRVEPKSKAETARVIDGLGKLCSDDPSLRLGQGEAGECILWGQGDLHLEVALERLSREFGVVALAGAPQVAFAYRLMGVGDAVGSVDKQNGGKGQFAKVQLRLEPLAEGAVFDNQLVGEAVPRKFVGAIERGVRAAMLSAGVDGFPVLAWKAVLLGGSAHAVDSSDMAFERAGFEAACKASQEAGLRKMEPMGKISAELPSSCVGALSSEIAKRSGRMLGIEESPVGTKILARAPMSKLFGFVASMRSATAGRASARIEPDGHEPVAS